MTDKINGHRELSKEQIDLINKIKTKGAELEEMIDDLYEISDTDKRALSVGRTQLQTALMWIVRSVAKPQ